MAVESMIKAVVSFLSAQLLLATVPATVMVLTIVEYTLYPVFGKIFERVLENATVSERVVSTVESVLPAGTLHLVDYHISFSHIAILLFVFIVLNTIGVFSRAEPPKVVYRVPQGDRSAESLENSDKKRLEDEKPNDKIIEVIKNTPILHQIYEPSILLGRNGHYQTASYGVLGRVHMSLANTRHAVVLDDNVTTVTFDVFEPTGRHPRGHANYTLALCPGIGNSSESKYIRTLVDYAQKAGYRVAVLNHLGAMRSVPLTSSRIFRYGGIEEYQKMMLKLGELYPHSRFLCIGFSMGGNIVTKYLGVDPVLVDRTVGGMSICQGYDANRSIPYMHQIQSLRRFYIYIMTENIKHLLRDHYAQVVAPFVKSGTIDEQLIWGSTSLLSFDEYYTRRVAGFKSRDEYYRWSSCSPHMDKINVPMLYLNALDDPLVPPALLDVPMKIAASRNDTAFVTTKHGGHLGYLDNGLPPHKITWLDRFIVQWADSLIEVYDGQ